MLIPIGLDNARLGRWPWVSISIAGICVLAYALTAFSDADREADRARSEAVGYLLQHPYLSAPDLLLRRLGLDSDPRTLRPVPARLSAPDLALERARLEALSEAFAAAQDATPVFRFSLVPAHGLFQPGWITYAFMHGGLGHLLGNLFIFLLLVGPFLEDAWGRLFFAAFYLAGGVVAAAVQAPMMQPEAPLLGASGAISACLGAFALRFAHRRVRMFYWFFLFVRGQFFVPAWIYALLGFGADLFGLELSGRGGGVAYACHVGGFVFGLGTAAVVRAARLEERLAPEGAVRWRGGLGLNRAAEALADGDIPGARANLEDTLRRHPGDVEAALELARLEARGLDAGRTTQALEPVLARRALAGDAAGVRALVVEFGGDLRADRLRPATAYRTAELLGDADARLALSLYEAAGAAGGDLGAKALLKAAGRIVREDPVRARALSERAAELAPDAELAARARAMLESLPRAAGVEFAEPRNEPGAAAFPGEEVRVVWCKVASLQGTALDLTTAEGRTARLSPARVELLAAAQLGHLWCGGVEKRNGVVLDLALRSRPGQPRVVLRIAGHEMNLALLRPGVPPARAYAELVAMILSEGGGQALPDTAHAQGRPFAQLPDLAAFERACYGRPLSDGAAAGA